MANTEGQNLCDTTELESSFSKNLNLRQHPEIGPYVTDTFRIRYAGLLKLFLQKPSVKKNLRYMHMMCSPSGVNEQFVHNESDNVRCANDILNFQVCKSAGILVSQNDKENLVKSLQISLENDGLNAEVIEAICNSFDGDLTCEEYVSVFVNLHLLKSCGFSHDRMFFAILQDLRSSGDKEKLVELSARYYVSILKANDNFNSDSARENFITVCRKYANLAPSYKPDEKLVSEIGQSGVATLTSIRTNALFNIKSFLTAEQKREKLYTPLETYALRETFPTIKFGSKQVEKLAKAISQANKEPINLTKSFQGFNVLWNCFICPSSDPSSSIGRTSPSPHPPSGSQSCSDGELGAREDESSTDRPAFQPSISFVDRVVARFNVLRLEPKNSRAAVDTHWVNVHTSLTQSQTNDLNGHNYIFFCEECQRDNLCESIICCSAHYESHTKILHSSSLTHFRVLTKLRELFKDDSCMLQIVDKFLLTVCNFCKSLFPDKEARDLHIEKICIPRSVTLSTYYGEPLLSTPAFKTRSALEAEKQERVTHLISCLKNISKHILRPGPQTVPTDPNLPSSSSGSTAPTVGASSNNASKKLDLFSTLVLEETQMDINTFPSPRSPSPAPSGHSVVATERTPTVASSKSRHSNTTSSTIPAVLSASGSTTDGPDFLKCRKAKETVTSRESKQGQKETKTEKRRQFHMMSKEAIEEHKRDRSNKPRNADEYQKDYDDDRDDDNDDDNDDGGNNSPRIYNVDATENGIVDEEEEQPGENDDMEVNEDNGERERHERMDDDGQDEAEGERRRNGQRETQERTTRPEVRARSGERIVRAREERRGREDNGERERRYERMDDDRQDEDARQEEMESERRRSGGRREAPRRTWPEERARSAERIAVVRDERRGRTPERGRDRVAWGKSGGPSTKVKSMAARRRLQFEDEYYDEEESEEEVPVIVRRPRQKSTARMHTSGALRMSKPVRKKSAPRYYFESDDDSRSPSPPSKRRKDVKVREIRQKKKKRPRTYMVINSDSESD